MESEKTTSPHIIGTRGSLLARTQSDLIRQQLHTHTSEKFEFKFIKTQGDQIQDKPLWQLDGKDFFTKELDQALLKKEIDCVVHSYKDLGSERPKGIKLAAITKREPAQDILLIPRDKSSKLPKQLVVGTSSPRRKVNITQGLSDLLPCFEGSVICKDLRGNVNTRIQKLKDGDYDAIVLAFAGLERLAKHPDSQRELKKLFEGLNFMLLPQSLFPSSASQGAIAIECRESDEKMQQVLTDLNHESTIQETSAEREKFLSYGGGCHLAVGIHVKSWKGFLIHSYRGTHQEETISERFLSRTNHLSTFKGQAFIGMPAKDPGPFLSDELISKESLAAKNISGNVFISSRYCLQSLLPHQEKLQTLWVAGNRSWRQMAAEGLWINGSADGLGAESLLEIKNSALLSLLSPGEWSYLSHDKASPEVGKLIPCYKKSYSSPSKDFEAAFMNCDAYYWGSYSQFEKYCEYFPAWKPDEKIHACGLGQTYDHFQSAGIEVIPFLTPKDFKDWAKGN